MRNIDEQESTTAIRLGDSMAKTNLDFTAYLWKHHEELDPDYIKRCKDYLAKLPRSNPFQDASNKQQEIKKHDNYKSKR